MGKTTLGIAGRDRDAAAALAIDGRIVAAAAEQSFARIPGIGYRHTDGFPYAAALACLERAGIGSDDVTDIRIVEEAQEPAADVPALFPVNGQYRELRARLAREPMRTVDALSADAAQVAASAGEGASVILLLGGEAKTAAVFLTSPDRLERTGSVAGADQLMSFVRRVARALGCCSASPFEELDNLAATGDPEFGDLLAEALRSAGDAGVLLDEARLEAALATIAGADAAALARPDGMNVPVQNRRRALAASALECLGRVVSDVATGLVERSPAERIGVGGPFFSSTRLNSLIRRSLGDRLFVPAIPETVGRPVGAALWGAPRTAAGLASVALGPEFSETDIKQALENCRLDYIYEPDWTRLLTRVSRMLTRGNTVAWFQGAMEFGPRPCGNRSILADPSNRSARDNVNRFLKQQPEDRRLSVSMIEAAAAECLEDAVASPFASYDAKVKTQWRDRLRAALDHRHTIPLQTVGCQPAPAFFELLRLHYSRTGVPGLINTPLSGVGEAVACSPRDAVRTMFSSAIDALVIGRFLLMKDYWLLRNDAEE